MQLKMTFIDMNETIFYTKKEEASHREATASNIDTTPITSENAPSTKSSSNNNIPQIDGVVNIYDMPNAENNAVENGHNQRIKKLKKMFCYFNHSVTYLSCFLPMQLFIINDIISVFLFCCT